MNKFFVISHTHWDREWYMTFEQFRFRLVDLMDHLLVILNKNPDYIFHLDAQTIMIEDYLEIRPSKKDIIKNYIKKGNIVTGPWYLQNDFNLTSGESTIRNLQRGVKTAQDLGGTQLVGYAPDQFGHISQIPQIMNNFGIDNYIFGRGYKEFYKKDDYYTVKTMPTEFILKGPDGSKCLAIYMKEWYNNGQRFSSDIEKVKKQLNINSERFNGFNVTPYILMMNGVDHLEPQENLLDIISKMKEEGFDVQQTSFENYLKEVKTYINENKIPLLEYDQPLNKGDDYSMLRGCWSSRILQKQMNVKAQDALENKIEPLLVTLQNSGFKGIYDLDYLDFMWKSLIKNHPHDSICGCSKDEVHNHIEDRYLTLKEITDSQLKKVMEIASSHTLKTELSNYTITVFNSTDYPTSDIIDVRLEFLKNENIKNFIICTQDNQELDYIVVEHFADVKDVVSPVNLPGVLDVDVYRILLKTPIVKPYSFQQFIIKQINGEVSLAASIKQDSFIENDFYKLSIKDASVQLYHKSSQKLYNKFITFINECDRGDTYVFEPTIDDKQVSRLVSFEILSNNDLYKEMKLTYELDTYSHYDIPLLKPSDSIISTKIEVLVVLKQDAVIDIHYKFVNKSKDHRVRMYIETNICDEGIVCDVPFDVMNYSKNDASLVAKSKTFCHTSFVAKKSINTVVLYTEGQHEVEEVNSQLALTILRSTGYIARVEGFKPCAGELFNAPGNQLLRTIDGRIGVEILSTSVTHATLFKKARAYRVGLLSYFNSANANKFLGGRFAVQDSSIAELFYLEDQYCNKMIPLESLFEINNDNIVVSSYRVNNDNNTILRLINLGDNEEICQIDFSGSLYETNMLEKEFIPVSKKIHFRAKEIKTLKVVYE